MSDDLKWDAEIAIMKAIKIAQDHYGREFTMPEITFRLRGRTAGYWHVYYATETLPERHTIKVHLQLMTENYEDYCKQVIPHEVAHMVAYLLHGKNISGHGYEWQRVMFDCFGLFPDQYHRYATSHLKKNKMRQFVYACACKSHTIPARKHNRLQKGHTYTCRSCGTALSKENYYEKD
jgi:SprT protein